MNQKRIHIYLFEHCGFKTADWLFYGYWTHSSLSGEPARLTCCCCCCGTCNSLRGVEGGGQHVHGLREGITTETHWETTSWSILAIAFKNSACLHAGGGPDDVSTIGPLKPEQRPSICAAAWLGGGWGGSRGRYQLIWLMKARILDDLIKKPSQKQPWVHVLQPPRWRVCFVFLGLFLNVSCCLLFSCTRTVSCIAQKKFMEFQAHFSVCFFSVQTLIKY